MNPDRAAAIRQHLFARGPASIGEIAAAVGASEPTVRRDLLALEAEGLIQRTHGGARLAEETAAEVAFESRERINLAAKRAIGEAAHALLRPESSVFLDAGTTVLQLARRLRLSPMPLRVFTNCLPVAQVLMPVAGIAVTLLGGALRPQNASTVGALAEEALDRLWFDQLFLGAGAVGDDACLYSADEQEARINARMLARAGAVHILADAAKFSQRLTYRVAPLQAGQHVLTDTALPAPWRQRLAEIGCPLTLAAPA